MTGLFLRGPLDQVAVDHLRLVVTRLPAGAGAIPVRCALVTRIDPVGVASLWRLCAEAAQRGVRLRLEELPRRFVNWLRRHPILAFVAPDVEEEIFQDPLALLGPSER
jgi:ABC-type transporter Mla MlaB component